MKLHPLLKSPSSVFVFQMPINSNARWEDFQTAAFKAMNWMQVELEGERVVIKPNVTSGEHFADPNTGITTHPGFVQGMVEFFHSGSKSNVNGHSKKDKHPDVVIVEDPRNSDDNEPRHWKKTGFDLLATETGARLHTTTTYTCIKKTVPHPLTFPRLNVSRMATAPNTVLLNVPKLKTHNLAITTLCMKNLMGLVNVFDRHYCAQAWLEMPEEVQAETRPRNEWLDHHMHRKWQEGLARRLVDTAQVIQPALNVVEGIIGREGTGFQRGRNRTLGLVVAGTNMVAVDSLASYLMGFDPQSIVYLEIAAREGLGESEISNLDVYTFDGIQMVPCPEPERLRATPPMKVISNVKDEDQELFTLNEHTPVDISMG